MGGANSSMLCDEFQEESSKPQVVLYTYTMAINEDRCKAKSNKHTREGREKALAPRAQ